jgi:hypothetical protein
MPQNYRLQQIITELCHLLDIQSLMLEGRVKLGDMSVEEIDTYVERNLRIRQLCNDLHGEVSDGDTNSTLRFGIHSVGTSRLVN